MECTCTWKTIVICLSQRVNKRGEKVTSSWQTLQEHSNAFSHILQTIFVGILFLNVAPIAFKLVY